MSQNIPMGSWRNHADYSAAQRIASFDSKIFCATTNGLFYFDLEDGSLNTLSVTDGLKSTNISMLQAVDDKLLIAYTDGLMDVLDSDFSIRTFDEIAQSELRGSKKINEAVKIGEIIYLATDFGVLLYDVDENELLDVFLDLGEEGERICINGISSHGGKLFLSTEQGLLIGDLINNTNLKDFQNWERIPIENNSSSLLRTVLYEATLFAQDENNNIYQLQNDSLRFVFNMTTPIEQLKVVNEQLFLSSDNQLYKWQNGDFELESTIAEASQINDFIEYSNQFFLADNVSGLIRYREGAGEKLKPQGPKGNALSLHQIEQFTFHLAKDVVGFSWFENGKWNYAGKDASTQNLPFFQDVALDLTSGNGIFLSKTEGVFSWDTNEITKLNYNHPSIQEWVRLAESPQASYWVLVKTDSSKYAIFSPEEEKIIEMNLPANRQVNDYLIVPNGDHYLATNSGIFVFNPESGEERMLSTPLGNGNLTDNKVTDLAVDLEGQLWIATQKGVSFFNSFQGVLNAEKVDASKPILDGFFLFDGTPVNHITIDGGNRKWMSTRDGLWLFDENVERNILHLKRANSPIVVNDILQMVVNPFNGELFFSSATQFLSYRTDATRANAKHATVEVFPNPVRLSTDKTVTIRGLAHNNEVMITDIAGNLLHKGKANGGTFSWDLGNYSGFKAKSGVYLVFSINSDGSETYQTKFAVLP